jgi:hypothetical protein
MKKLKRDMNYTIVSKGFIGFLMIAVCVSSYALYNLIMFGGV